MGYLIPLTPQAFVRPISSFIRELISNQFSSNYIYISLLQLRFLHHIKSRVGTPTWRENGIIIFTVIIKTQRYHTNVEITLYT